MSTTAQGKLIQALRDSGEKQTLPELDQQLNSQRALGFGVELSSVVGRLVKEGHVTFDPKTDVVSLNPSKL